jgi:CheY-like chemotaxis protein
MSTATDTHRKTVLVADDEPYIGRIIQMKLEDGPYRVELVHDGREALERLRTDEAVDLVLLDIMMPVVSGLEAIPDILSVSPQTRIVGYSAYEGYREEALELGAHGWCTKGLPWADVADTIVELTKERDEAASASENHRS